MAYALGLAFGGHTAAWAADITANVTGVRNGNGNILVAICPRAQFLQPHCPWHGSAPAHIGTVTVTIAGVPPGQYAAQAFHDEDSNGILERSFFGLPREGMGFSNNAPMHFGPPRFDAAAFSVAAAPVVVGFSLKYY